MRKCLWRLQFSVPAVWVIVFLTVVIASSGAQTLCSTGVCVLTWQNDTYRTGNNLSESRITPSSILTDTFGKICAVNLDAQVFAQPLVVTNVKTNWPNVVYVVTENDTYTQLMGTRRTATRRAAY